MDTREVAINTHVIVVWEDSSYRRGWVYPEEGQYELSLAPARARTTGWVIVCTPESLTIASSIAEQGGALNPLVLPWGSILSLAEIKDDANDAGDAGMTKNAHRQ